jgi:hypothetical protein
MFTVVKLGDKYWAVFLVNPRDETDRYMMTSPLDKKEDAEHFQREFTRIHGPESPNQE